MKLGSLLSLQLEDCEGIFKQLKPLLVQILLDKTTSPGSRAAMAQTLVTTCFLGRGDIAEVVSMMTSLETLTGWQTPPSTSFQPSSLHGCRPQNQRWRGHSTGAGVRLPGAHTRQSGPAHRVSEAARHRHHQVQRQKGQEGVEIKLQGNFPDCGGRRASQQEGQVRSGGFVPRQLGQKASI